VDAGEECDDGEDNSDEAPGACRTDCRLAHCGDGVVDPGEECDEGEANSDELPDACRTNCALPWCGDGVVDSEEECDEGDANSDEFRAPAAATVAWHVAGTRSSTRPRNATTVPPTVTSSPTPAARAASYLDAEMA